MLFKARTREKSNPHIIPVARPQITTHRNDKGDTLSADELRLQMYERIAQGNALAEAEDQAQRLWSKR